MKEFKLRLGASIIYKDVMSRVVAVVPPGVRPDLSELPHTNGGKFYSLQGCIKNTVGPVCAYETYVMVTPVPNCRSRIWWFTGPFRDVRKRPGKPGYVLRVFQDYVNRFKSPMSRSVQRRCEMQRTYNPGGTNVR